MILCLPYLFYIFVIMTIMFIENHAEGEEDIFEGVSGGGESLSRKRTCSVIKMMRWEVMTREAFKVVET